jgi:hypothetical protein
MILAILGFIALIMTLKVWAKIEQQKLNQLLDEISAPSIPRVKPKGTIYDPVY